jgi:uncharacterized protein (TIGR03437 family)
MQICGLGLGSTATTQVLVNDMPVPVVSVASDSVLALAPATLTIGGTFNLIVRRDGVSSDARAVPAAAVNPALFTSANLGSGQALAANEDDAPNSPQQTAHKGHRLRLFATGLGAVDSLGQPLAAVTANVAGIRATVLGVTPAAGFPNGYFAIDIAVPQEAPAADFVPVSIEVGGITSQAGVTVALR